MALIVQKYGGSSVASPERIKAVAQRVKQTVDAGNRVVVVVSAMGKTTDGLIKLSQEISTAPSPREMDMLLATGEQVSIAVLSMALQELGQPAISLNGAQVRIVTEPIHTRARILYVETELLHQYLNSGQVVIVAGFQGVAADAGNPNKVSTALTTLGRGGSDTSAVAIAAALQADLCEIYTDVPGILTTDPRLVPKAQLLAEITSDEMLELASLGAKVLHPRSVEIARNFGVKLAVRSSWTDDPGTFVLSAPCDKCDYTKLEVNRFVDAVLLDVNQAKVALLKVPDRPGIASQLFEALAQAGINVDLIVQSIQAGDVNDIAFTLPREQLAHAQSVVNALNLGGKGVVSDSSVAKVSIVGVGIVGRPGVAAQMFAALAEAGINIQMISTSEIKLSCVVASNDAAIAIATLQKTFNVPISNASSNRDLHLGTIPVRGVALDLNQARLAVRNVPDRPGVAASLFQELARHNITVDMIIQSHSEQGVNDIAFTVPIGDMQTATEAIKQIATDLNCGEVVSDGAIAKVSIVGTGMIEQPGVAARMFTALKNEDINIEMIATSEIKVSCVVRQTQAEKALQVIHQAFELAGEQTILVPSVSSPTK